MKTTTCLILSLASLLSVPGMALTCGEAKRLPDNTAVTLSDKSVSAVLSSESAFYIQEDDRSAGIRVSYTPAGLATGDRVNIGGSITTRIVSSQPSERQITANSVTRIGPGPGPVPLSLNSRTAGGEADPPHIPGVKDSIGLTNMGLLVKVRGDVTAISSSSVWVDDGSNIADTSGRIGILARMPAANPPVSVGDLVEVSGVLVGSVPTGWTENRRMVQTRNWADLQVKESPAPLVSKITGTVSSVTGSAIQNARIILSLDGFSADTNASGAYTIGSILPGTYTITVEAEGYKSATQSTGALASGQTTIINFVLNPVPISYPYNGDFEQGFASGVGNSWGVWKSQWSPALTYSSETTNEFAGTASQKWGRADSSAFNGGLFQQVSVKPGLTYEVLAWVKLDSSDTSAWLEFGVDTTGQTANGEAASVSYTKLETGGTRKWLRYRRIVKATGSTLTLFTKFGRTVSMTGPHYALIDNITIQPRIVLEPEDYNNGYDTTTGNTGNVYRSGNVDLTTVPTGGYSLGWTEAGEWVEWTGIATDGGEYTAAVEYSGYSNASVSLRVNGVSTGGAISLPKSGWWDSYRRVSTTTPITLAAGTHTIRLTIETAGCNIDRVVLIPVSGATVLQAEDFASSLDTTTGNAGGLYRSTNTDIYLGSEGYYVGSIANSEWLEFPVSGDGRTYALVARYAATSSGSITVNLNGNAVVSSMTLPTTSGMTNWRSRISSFFTLPTGDNTLRVHVNTGGFNLNWLALVPLGDGDAGHNQLMSVHFGGSPSDLNNMASLRGDGNWLYSVEVYATTNRDPEDPFFIQNMTSWITGYLKPLYQNRYHPVVRLDYNWGETIPRLLAGNAIDTAKVERYAQTFKKFAQLAEANGVPVRQFVVANEMNLKAEAVGFANGYIPEWYYAYVYDAVVRQVRTLGPGYEVLVGGLSPGSLTPDPLYPAPDSASFYNTWSTDCFVYLDNVVQEIKRRQTPDVGFALHAYANFDANDNYANDFMWAIRKQLEIINKTHTVTPYNQANSVVVGGYYTAPIYVTEWNRHTPQTSPEGRIVQETRTSGFIRQVSEAVSRWNRNREVYDNVSNVYRTYDHRDVQHNFHPIKALCYFVFDAQGGPWGDYALKDWFTLPDSATGINDMYETYRTEIGRRSPAGR